MPKLIPHTANALTTALTDEAGNSEYLAMSQKGATALATGEASAGIEDAPSDGKSYVRKDGAWVEASAGIEDSPSDGKFYVRKDGAWVAIEATPAE